MVLEIEHIVMKLHTILYQTKIRQWKGYCYLASENLSSKHN